MAGNAEPGVLPASPEVERSLLGTLLLNSHLLKEAAEIVRPDDSSLDGHRRIFHAMRDVERTEECFDEVIVAMKLGPELSTIGGAAYLSDLTSGAIERSTVKPLCEAIREKSILRRMAMQAEALQSAALTPGITLEECRKRVSSILTLSDGVQSYRLRACAIGEFLQIEIPVREMVLNPILPTQGLAIRLSGQESSA